MEPGTQSQTIIEFRKSGEIVEWNKGATSLLGYQPGEVISQYNMQALVGDCFSEIVSEMQGESPAQNRKIILGHSKEIEIKRKDGMLLPCEITAEIMVNNRNKQSYFAILRDISKHKAIEESIRRHNLCLESLQAISLQLMSRRDLNSLLEEIMDRAIELFGTSHAYLYLVNEEKNYLEAVKTRGFYNSIFAKRLKKGEEVCGRIWDTGQLFVTEEYSRLPWGCAGRENVHAWLGVPLKQGVKPFGVIGLARIDEDHRPFSQEEVSIMEQLASLASIAIINARTDRELADELTRRKQIESELQTMNSELEQRVKERTLELAVANEVLTDAQQKLTVQCEILKQASESQRRTAQIQSILKEIAEAAMLSPSLDELYASVHGLVGRLLPVSFFLINFLDKATHEIVLSFRSDEANFIPQRRPMRKGLTEYIMQLGRAVHLTSAEMDRLRENGEYTLKKIQKVKVQHYLGAPLIDSYGKAFGVLSLVLMEEKQTFLPEDVEVLSIIAAQVSLSIERRRAEEAVKSSQARYQALVEQSFEALALLDIQTQELLEVNRRFTELFGYSLPKDAPLFAKIIPEHFSQSDLDRTFATLKEQRVLLPAEMSYRHKNGSVIHAERAATAIMIDGRDYGLISIRDMTEERRRQTELVRDAAVAMQVQRDLLPELPQSPFVAIRTLYHPSHFVSGDSYHLEWRNDGKLLRGFLIDVSGHGLATAIQASSINVLLREAITERRSLKVQLKRVNACVGKYFTEGSYAAMLGFELDFSMRELRYVGAGITQFNKNGNIIKTPGMFVGMWDNAEFTMGKIAVMEGDTFYFLTDGFTDWLDRQENSGFLSLDGKDMEADVAVLQRLVESGKLRDDATGVCLRVL